MFAPNATTPALLQRRRAMDAVNPTPAGKLLAHPAERAPRIFADTADINAIRVLRRAGIINGVTTNPTLVKKAGAKSWDQAKEMLAAICRLMDPMPVSLELTKLTPDEMIEQASELAQLGKNSVIKVPIGGYQAIDPALDPHTGLKVLHALWEKNIKTNCTLVFNTTQAFFAAQAGATYVSPFLGRLADYCFAQDEKNGGGPGSSLYGVQEATGGGPSPYSYNTEYVAKGGPRKDSGTRLIFEIAQVFAQYDIQTEILAASLRHPGHIAECLMAGADILTVPANLLTGVADHPLTHAGMTSFVADSKAFGG